MSRGKNNIEVQRDKKSEHQDGERSRKERTLIGIVLMT